MTEVIANEASVTAEVDKLENEADVKTINAKNFRQEWEENCKMCEEDLQPETREEKAAALSREVEGKQKLKQWREKLQEDEKKIFRTPLSIAAWDSNLGLVQNLVKQQGTDINQSDGDGRTPLGAAISKATGDNFEIVRLLVDAGADINKVSVKNISSICTACRKAGNLELIQFMVEHGADTKGALSAAAGSGDMTIVQYLMELGGLDIDNDGTISPICQAAARSDFELVRFFVEQGAKLTGALHSACEYCEHDYLIMAKRLSTISYLLEQGADKDEHHDGDTPLFHAIQSSLHADSVLVIIKYLILLGADTHKLSGSTGLTLVHAAICRLGHQPSLPILKYLHEQGLDLHKLSNDQVSPLQFVLEHGHEKEEHLLDIVRFFIGHGAKINQDNQGGDSALVHACRRRFLSICKLLVEHGADVNQIDMYGLTPLDSACIGGHLDICQFLVEHGADKEPERSREDLIAHFSSSFSPLRLAAFNGHLEIVEYLVRSGVDVRRDDSRFDGISTSALYDAASRGHLPVVRFLFETCGADVEKRDSQGNTAVFTAASKGHLDVLKYLLEVAKAQQQTDRHGRTLLNVACRGAGSSDGSNNLGVVQYLFENSHHRHQADERGQTPLFSACSAGRTEIVQYLLKDAEVAIGLDRVDDEGRTALHAAVERRGDNVAIVQCLVEHGAQINRGDNGDITALWLAAAYGNLGVAEYLIDHGAEVNKAPNDGTSPLHIVAAEGHQLSPEHHLQMISMLLAFGASLKERDIEGLLPIDVAANDEIRQLINEEFTRRRDHGYKRAVLPHPTDAEQEEEEEQENKRRRLEDEGDSGGSGNGSSSSNSNSSSSGQASASSTLEEKETLEEDEESEPSDVEED